MLEDYQSYASRVLEVSMAEGFLSFDKQYPPLPRWIKVNTDAAILRDLGVGLGWVARDHNENIVKMGVKRIKASWGAEMAKFDAARFALSHASKRGWRYVILESDALGLTARL